MTETEKIADVVVAAVRASTKVMSDEMVGMALRLSTMEASHASMMASMSTMTDRMVACEQDLAGCKGQISSLQTELAAMQSVGKSLAVLDGRVQELSFRSAVPGPPGRDGLDGKDAPAVDFDSLVMRAAALISLPKDGRDGRDGIDGKDAPAVDLDALALKAAELIPKPKDGQDGKDGRDGQPGVPGTPGRDGQGLPGEKGLDGKDGRDGTLEGATLAQVDDRTFQIVRADGSPLSGHLKFAVLLDRGVYRAGQAYEKGDGVTYGGSFWIAQAETSEKPGDGATKWRLAVKAGRDGREGKPGERGLTGLKGDRGEAGRNFS